MKKTGTYKKIKRAIRNELKHANKWLAKEFNGRFMVRAHSTHISRTIDQSYPVTNMNIPFYFYHAYVTVELIDLFNPINNVIISFEAYGDNSTKNSDKDEVDKRIHISYDHSGWEYNSWLQYTLDGAVCDSPPNINTHWHPEIPTHNELTKTELEYYVKLLKEYLELDTAREATLDNDDITTRYNFRKSYIVENDDKYLYGIFADNVSWIYTRKKYKTVDPYYLLIRDPNYKCPDRHADNYANLRGIYFESQEKFYEFLDLLGDEKNTLKLILTLGGF